MEQKNTLWIIAVCGGFLLVVFGAALILNSSPSSVPATASITTIDRSPAIAQVDVPVINPIQPSDTSSVDLRTSNNSESASSSERPAETKIKADTTEVTINTNTTNIELKTASAPSVNVTATSRAGQEALEATTNTAKSQKSNASTSKATAKASAKPKAQTATAKASSAAPLSTKYWVQAAAYTSKRSADNARNTLDDNKIPAEVFTYKDEKKDTLFYRVRVGPYTTKSEAEYWKGRIVSIDLFKNAQSYVTAVKM